MPNLNLSTASPWDIGRLLESERQARIDAHLDDREADLEPCYLYFDEED